MLIADPGKSDPDVKSERVISKVSNLADLKVAAQADFDAGGK